jgi:hypothetical protein
MTVMTLMTVGRADPAGVTVPCTTRAPPAVAHVKIPVVGSA